MKRVPLRDDLEGFGAATYICTVPGAVTMVGALTVNVATEALDFRSACGTDWARLTDSLFEPQSADGLFLLPADDPASDVIVRRGCRVAELRAVEGAGVQIRWLSRRPESVEQASQFVKRLAERGLLYDPLARLRSLLHMPPPRITSADLAPALDRYLDSSGPVQWPHPFLPYQREGIRTLVARPSLLLADDMGLGKTVQAAAALRILIRTGVADDALIVAPASLIGQWYRALALWAPDLRISTVQGHDRAWRWRAAAHLFLVSFETLRSDFTENPDAGPRRRSWGAVVLDEAQKIKNREVDVARACKRLSRDRSWALTGTPLENQVDDLRSICEFLVPAQSAHRELADPERLRQTHAGLQLRRRKRDVLADLPEKTVIEVPLRLTPHQQASYDRVEREGVMWLRSLGRAVTITHVLELITRLKQVCNFCPESGESAKFNDLADRLDTLAAEGNRALVFTQYTDEQFGAAALANRLRAHHPEVYTGALSAEEKDVVIQRFRAARDSRPLILSLRAGGYGLNLQEASYVFHFDRWWNPAVEHQAEDRSHRMGQTQPVTVYAYLCEDTIEMRIQTILQQKNTLFKEWVDDVGIPGSQALTEAEIFGLVGLQPPVHAA